MIFKATESQIKDMAINAIKASSPMGMGHFAHNPHQVFVPDDIEFTGDGLDLDYVQGRMVKLHIHRLGEKEWEVSGMSEEPRTDYQSWAIKYPTFKDLAESVGIVV